ncbi:hypothetical protein JCM2421_21190 [Staphylococcus auricularis]|nr:hypothetical protein [Staphylococcus auricularis]BCU53347.1 hypothetical protein JCM2421_21190 [Staphylococcus auricularis]
MGSTWSSAASSAELFSVVSVVCGALDSSLSAAYASWFTPNINVDPINIEAVPTENLRILNLERLLVKNLIIMAEKIPPSKNISQIY